MKKIPQLALIIPVYNEEECLDNSCKILIALIQDLIDRSIIAPNSKINLINDGSKDKTWQIIEEISKNNTLIYGLNLGRNYGQQYATMAGLFEIEADVYITIDIDLQDDIAKIEDMIEEYKNKNHVVFGVRSDRSTDSFAKRWSAGIYYWLMQKLGMIIIPQHSEFRLLSKFAVEKLKQYPERNIFLRGIIASMGLKSSKVYFKRQKRTQGETKYSFKKLFKLAMDSLIDFSTTPLKIIVIIAFLFILISFGIFIYIITSYIKGYAVSGWSSLLASIYLVGGAVMFSLALLAEYIAKIYLETKKRPRYIIESTTDKKEL